MKKEKYFRLNKEETEALAQEYGTPLLVLSLEQIEKNYRLLRTHLPRVKFFYAIKANPHRRILELMRDLGSNFDVASDGSKHPFTAHTTNRVPFIIVDEKAKLTGIEDGRLSDIAPTMLTMAGIEPSAEMTGRVLATEA